MITEGPSISISYLRDNNSPLLIFIIPALQNSESIDSFFAHHMQLPTEASKYCFHVTRF